MTLLELAHPAAFRRKVYGLAYSYLRDRDAAEDVAQEVFVKLWRALPRYDGRAALATWIYAITRNASVSALRARRVRAAPADAQDTFEPDEAAADRAALLRLVEALPERQRQVIMLFYMGEHSHEEVAQMLGAPVGTVKTLPHRARARLSAAAGAPPRREVV